MSIVFNRLKYKNFLSTGNDFIEIELDSHKNTLIVGNNGEGKSTMICALCFVLFGKPFRKINKGGVVNSINNKNCLVSVDFRVNDSFYTVNRGIKPNIFEIYKNGSMIDQNSNVKDYQEILEDITGLNYRTFTQNVVLGSASYTPFMQLKPTDRRQLIEDLLDIGMFSEMLEIVKTKNSELKTEIKEKEYRERVLKDQITSQIESLNKSKIAYESIIKDYQESIKNDNLLIEELKVKLSNISLKDVSKAKSIRKEFEKILYDLNQKKANILAENNFLKKDLSNISSDRCSMCGQSLKNDLIKNKISDIETKISDNDSKILDTEKFITEANAKISQLQKIIEENQKTKTEYENLSNRIEYVNKSICDKLKNIEDIKNKKDEFVDLGLLSKMKSDMENVVNDKNDLLDDKKYYECVSDMLRDDGVKSLIIKNYLPFINQRVNYYLEKMDSFFDFELDENFNETIKSRYRDSFNYYNFSEGEKQRIDIALLLTWRDVAKQKNSVNTNILILDEIFDSSLDAGTIDRLSEILLDENNGNVFIISHNTDNMIDKFDRVIEAKKIDNFTTLTVIQ